MDISKLCYELYKIDWKYSHAIAEREMNAVKDYYEGLVNDDTEYTYDDYIEEFGYDGELYVCYGEFLESEYLNEEYMCELLDNERLISLYCKDISTFSDKHECEDRDEIPPLINIDRIRSMSIEQMAEFMNECGHDIPPYCDSEKTEICDQNCLSCAKQWLLQ